MKKVHPFLGIERLSTFTKVESLFIFQIIWRYGSMVGFKKVFLSLFFGLLVVVLAGCEKDDKVKIGITQFVDHPALNRAKDGFVDALAERGFVDGENITIEFQSAQTDVSNANLIASTFVSKKVDLIYAIATPSAQAAKNATEGTDIPVLFSAVTDPVGAELVASNERPGGNVSGTSDMSPMDKQFAIIKAILGSNKKIGVLFNTGEQNSVVQVDAIKEAAKADGHTIVAKGVTDTQQLLLELQTLVGQVDAFLIPTDNLMASNIELIVTEAKETGKPVFGTEAGMVEGGALATEGINYYDLGFQTGNMAADVLEGKVDISELAVELSEITELVINLKTAEELGITIPEDLLTRATKIGDGE